MPLKSSSFFACLTAALFAAGSAAAGPAAQTFSYRSPQGETYFAVGLQAAKPVPGAKNHIMLVDTSASQIGEHRELALAASQQFLAKLPQDHTVCIMAVDVQCTTLTSGFVPVQGDEVREAFQKLARRVPLGATNLEVGLRQGLKQIGSMSDASVVYIGDGMSAAQLISLDRFAAVTSEFRQARIPVNCLAVGPQTDLNLLGILAVQTGGVVIVENEDMTAEVASDQLVSSVSTGAVYPDSVTVTNSDARVSNAAGLPLRSDRSTFVLAKGELSGDEAVQVRVGQQNHEFTIVESKEGSEYPFLVSAWNNSVNTNGLSAGFPGAELLVMTSSQFDADIDNMVEMGKLALSLQQYDRAREIAESIHQLDPTNLQSNSLLVATDRKARLVAFVKDEQPPTPNAGDEDLDQLGRVKDGLRIRSEQLTLEVNNLVDEARKLSNTDPDDALNNLKNALGTVRAAQDVFPETRDQLQRRLQAVIQDVQGRKQVFDLQASQALISFTEQETLKRLDEEMRLDDEKFQQLLERVRSLMLEGVHGVDQAFEDAESVAEEAINLRPESGVAWAGFFKAEVSGQLVKTFRLRFRRADEFLAVLYEVEKSHVPFPDEPPIRWPSPEVWQDMTERRAKWKRTNLKQNSPIEERILKVLDEPYKQAQFLGVPLGDVMADIGSSKQIPWAAGDGVEISEQVPEIDMISNLPPDVYPSLRSVLKRVLGSLELRYIIKDETLLIVRAEDEEEMYFTYVYPVGDLVINPIQLITAASSLTQNAGGVGNGLTQGGGLNQGGNQGGGGQQNFGGNQGGNQGIFSVRPQAPNRIPPRRQPQQNKLQKKQVDAETKELLEGILGEKQSSVTAPREFYQAQVKDNVARSPRLDNSALDQLKKKL